MIAPIAKTSAFAPAMGASGGCHLGIGKKSWVAKVNGVDHDIHRLDVATWRYWRTLGNGSQISIRREFQTLDDNYLTSSSDEALESLIITLTDDTEVLRFRDV
ncbi:hypothetical protein KCU71_g174, partial [Aureobasidium melanogenum]